MPKVFAIVVTWNGMRFDWINKCLSSLQKSDIHVQIIVVDNCSSDNSVEYVQDNFPAIQLISSSENIGFGAANNLGLEKALQLGGEYFFLLNQDAWVNTNTIRMLVEQSQNNPEFGILSPIHLNGKGNALEEFFESRIVPSNCPDLYSDFVLNQVRDKIYKSGFINAAAWLLTKECVKKVGGFSPIFYHYAEDDNFVQRLFSKKLMIGVYPKVFIFHDKENSKTHAQTNPETYRRRLVKLHLSSPDRDFSSNYFLWHIRKEIIKNIFYMKMSKFKLAMQDYIYFRINTNNIEIQRAKSLSESEYIFLNYQK